MSGRIASPALALLASWMAGPASAQLPDAVLDLRWDAPDGCPDVDAVRAAVGRLVRRPDAASAERVVARGAVRPEASRFRLRLSTGEGDAAAERELTADGCQALADAAALILALMIDPGAGPPAVPPPDEPPPREPPPADDPDPASSPPPAPGTAAPAVERAAPAERGSELTPPREGAADPATRAAEPERRGAPDGRSALDEEEPAPWPAERDEVEPPDDDAPRRLRAGIGVLGDAGSLPGATPGVAIGAAARLGRFGLELEGRLLPLRRARPGGRADVRADLSLYTVGARACFAVVDAGRVTLSPCAGLEVGRMRGESFGVSAPASGSAPWLALSAGAALSIRLRPRFGLRAVLEGLLPASTPPFVIDGVGVVHEASPFAGRLTVGGEVHF